MMQRLYYHITAKSAPFLELLLKKRLGKGKEDPARLGEKTGVTDRRRPDGSLLWLHAASVGEAQSALILLDRCLSEFPDLNILLTTGTLTSAQLMQKRLPVSALHQFAPLDHPQWVERFLDHWQPDFVLWMESELWPNMLQSVKRRKIPAILVNARLSPRSHRLWSIARRFAGQTLSAFDSILCQTERDKVFYEALGGKHCVVTNNIKYSAKPLSCDMNDLDTMRKAVFGRPVWLFASTHDAEEELACRVHIALRAALPDVLTIIVPRHPERRDDIISACAPYGLNITARGNDKTPPADDCDVYIADTLGELGLFYRLAPLACIGRSFSKDGGGGHNPIEAAQLGCAVLHGTKIQNLQDVFDDMNAHDAALRIGSENALTVMLREILGNPERLEKMQYKALAFSREKSGAVERVMDEILPPLRNAILAHKIRPSKKSGSKAHAPEDS